MVYLLGFLLLLGATLLVIGLEGRLVDDTPYCTHCRYNLTGLTANRCPECGTEVSLETVEFGRRARNRPMLAAGGILLALVLVAAGSFVVGEFRGVNWYQYYSVGRLLDMAARGVGPANGELFRRIGSNQLSQGSKELLIDTALARHAASLRAVPQPVWGDLLALLEQKNQLSPLQRDVFFSSIVGVSVRARKIVRIGEPLVIEAEVRPRGSQFLSYFAQIHIRNLAPSENAEAISMPLEAILTFGRDMDHTVRAIEFLTPELGTHLVTGIVETKVVSILALPETTSPAWQRQVPFSSGYEVISEENPDPVQWIDRPDLAESIRKSLYSDQARFHMKGTLTGLLLRKGVIRHRIFLERGFDVDLAFDVFYDVGGREIKAGHISWSKGETGWRSIVSDSFRAKDADRVHVILRGSRDAAIRTADCYNIWRGEVRMPSVIVTGR